MQGSTDECMATAIEASHTVIICVSKQYKSSANCRLECSYAHRRFNHGSDPSITLDTPLCDSIPYFPSSLIVVSNEVFNLFDLVTWELDPFITLDTPLCDSTFLLFLHSHGVDIM